MSRKDDPVFNVKFVQAVERNQCLWNSTLPAYSKKEEIQKAWQDVANETKDTVRSCRERWRTIRSSFLRSLKMSRTNTGRGKRKYYLSKYLQFLIPYTKTRLKHATPGSMMALRKYSTTSTSHFGGLGDDAQTPNTTTSSHTPFPTPLPSTPPPMTCINQMPLPIVSSDDTKDSTSSDIAAIAEEDIVVSLVDTDTRSQQQPQQPQPQQQHMLYNMYNNNNNNFHSKNNANYGINSRHNNNNDSNNNGYYNQQFQHATTTLQQQLQQQIQQHHQPLRLPSTIKSEPRGETSSNSPANLHHTTAPISVLNKNSADNSNSNNNNNNYNTNNNNNNNGFTAAVAATTTSNPRATIASSTAMATVDLSEFADWIKNKNVLPQQLQRQYVSQAAQAPPPDADQSFLASLHPFLKEMTGKQNRRFRQKVVALIDAILDNAD